MVSTPSTQTTINKTELPPWVDKAAQENLGIADQLAQRPYQGYDGSLTAGASPLQSQAYSNASNNAGAWNGLLSQAALFSQPTSGYQQTMQQALAGTALTPQFNGVMNAATGVAGGSIAPAQAAVNAASGVAQQGTTYRPQSFLNANIQDYMNPYIDQVENRALDNAGRAFQQNVNQIGANATSAGAFGGSRQGIAEGVAASENARSMGDLSAQLRAQGFDTASGLLENDISRDMQGQQMRLGAADQLANYGALGSQIGLNSAATLASLAGSRQQMGMDAAGQQAQIAQGMQDTNLAAGSQLAGIAQTGDDMSNKNSALLATLGEQQRGIEQQRLQEQYAKWQEEQQFPLQQLNMRLAAVGATPYGGTQTQTSTGAGGGNAGMSIFGSVLGLLPMLFGLSDETMKTDKVKIGKDPTTGIDLYSYRYKGDPKSYPKVVGPMAQDIEKKFPGAVTTLAGKKAVNLGFGRQTGLLPR